jgi:hypothetical protein
VLELAAVDRHTNAVWLDEGAVERRLESDPWVAEAEVRVSLGLAIEISVTERVPVAVASGEGGSVLVASDGTTLGAAPRSASVRSLPQIELPAVPPIEGTIAPTPAGAALALGARDGDLRAAVDRVAVLPAGPSEVWMRRTPGELRFRNRARPEGPCDRIGARLGPRSGGAARVPVRGRALGTGGDARTLNVRASACQDHEPDVRTQLLTDLGFDSTVAESM